MQFETMKPQNTLDFDNTEIAFTNKTDRDLKDTYRMFQVMNNPRLVSVLSTLGKLAVAMRLPFHERMIRRTMFRIFCGGISLQDSQRAIDLLGASKVLSVLDYGAEGKSSEADLDFVMEEVLTGIRFAASNDTVPVVVTKMTALAPNELLERLQQGQGLGPDWQVSKTKLEQRLRKIGELAESLSVRLFIDAEETWMQDAIDDLVREMMRRHNRKAVIVYATFQLYLKDALGRLINEYATATQEGYKLGAKIVRGAYMEKERTRALDEGRESPIHDTKNETDEAFDAAVRFCVTNYKDLASCTATHNLKSNMLQARLIDELGIQKNHSHLNFCQLLGMSDYITYNLAAAGYNVAKYLVYGPVRDVVPYLIRRAEENTSITGEMSRELGLIRKEMKRRGLL